MEKEQNFILNDVEYSLVELDGFGYEKMAAELETKFGDDWSESAGLALTCAMLERTLVDKEGKSPSAEKLMLEKVRKIKEAGNAATIFNGLNEQTIQPLPRAAEVKIGRKSYHFEELNGLEYQSLLDQLKKEFGKDWVNSAGIWTNVRLLEYTLKSKDGHRPTSDEIMKIPVRTINQGARTAMFMNGMSKDAQSAIVGN